MTTWLPRLMMLLALSCAGCKLETDATPHGVVRKYLGLVGREKCEAAWELLSANRRASIEQEFQRSGARLRVATVKDMYCRPRAGNPYATMVPHSVQLRASSETEGEVLVDGVDSRDKWTVLVVKEGAAWRVDNARPQ
jgi:hypothetical protein